MHSQRNKYSFSLWNWILYKRIEKVIAAFWLFIYLVLNTLNVTWKPIIIQQIVLQEIEMGMCRTTIGHLKKTYSFITSYFHSTFTS